MNMKKIAAFIVLMLSFVTVISCDKTKEEDKETKETYSSGKVSVLVEESVVPIFEDIVTVFKSVYTEAEIEIIPATENKILKMIYEDSTRLAVLPKKFDEKEVNYFKGKVAPIETPFAKDAIIFIANKTAADSLIKYEDVVAFIKEQKKDKEKVFVFDNINSSLVRQFRNDAGVTDMSTNVYFFPTTAEVIAYVAKNKNAVGVVGINWLMQPDKNIDALKKDIKTLSVFNKKENKYFKASQSTIADGTYPLVREIYILDLQGKMGLGRGIASFAAGDKGQRIVLKSGLLPVTLPPREVIVNNQ